MRFDNSYSQLPDRFYSRVRPATAPEPALVAWNHALADELGLSALADDESRLTQIFSGNAVPDWADPIALAYAGHQFGHFVPQLGDGRALLLAEVVTADGRRYDLQLKGSGQTPYSRNGDGMAPLGPVIREYILSEAMHHLGVPTTRTLAAVQTGAPVYREDVLPGAVLTRVAASHLRVGTFEYFAAREDVEALAVLTDYAIARHYPEARDDDHPRIALLRCVIEAQAELVAHWMAVGFIHGVMNTDNCAISGETIDYGPCAFMDEFDYHKVFSSIDQHGRYAFAQQGPIAYWNLARLAECLLVLGEAQARLQDELDRFQGLFERRYLERMRAKLGLAVAGPDDADLVAAWLQHLQDNTLDFTLSFRRLGARVDAEDTAEFGTFESRWRRRLADEPEPTAVIRERMEQVNPMFIPRNHQVERAIAAATHGDLSLFHQLNRILLCPFEEQAEFAEYAEAPLPEQRVRQTFCGT